MDIASDGTPFWAWEGPDRFDDFVVVRPLGRGGMGQVFLGHDEVLDRAVALKFTASAAPTEAARSRFLREARAIARLAHPNVVGVYRVGEVGGRPYLAYELVPGKSLDHVRLPLPWQKVLRIALGVARGLTAAHAAGVLHRDIKPGNVMLSASGEVKVLDFGLATLDPGEAHAGVTGTGSFVLSAGALAVTQAVDAGLHDSGPRGVNAVGATRLGAVMGTPAYIPPEIWGREPPTARSDLYAFGLLLFELLTGRLPHAGREAEDLIRAVTTEDAPPIAWLCPDLPGSFAALIDQCLSRAPALRPPSADDVRRTLEDLHAVFIPATAEARLLIDDTDAELCARSFLRVLPRVDEFTASVYARLFLACPELRSLFPGDLAGQRHKLAHALRLAIDGLREHERLAPVLRDLGRLHGPYALTDAHFDSLGDALLGSLAEIVGALPDDDTARAWRRAYSFMVRSMREGSQTPANGESTGVSAATGSPAARAVEVRVTPPSAPRAPAGTDPLDEPPPRTQYAFNGDVGVAYQVFGEGPVDVVIAMGWVSHVELSWRHPALAGFLRAIGRFARVILFDKRGTGMSDRTAEAGAFELGVDDVLAVLDAVGARDVVLFGISDGASLAALFSAIHPERVRGAVLFAGAARMLRAPDYPVGHAPEFLETVFDEIRRRWGEPVFIEIEAPSLAHDAEFRAWFAEYLRMSASPGNAIAMLRRSSAFDIRRLLRAVHVPTLLLHRVGDAVSLVGQSRHMAAQIPEAHLVELPGADHLPFAGDVPRVIAEIERFARTLPPYRAPTRALVTLLAARADDPAAEALGALATIAAPGRGKMREVASPQSRCYAFDGPVRAAECALSLIEHAAARGEIIRVGLHVGDCALGGDVTNEPAAALAAALAARAAPGEALATDDARMLAAGVRLTFEAAGEIASEGVALSVFEVRRG
jgi:eukaryotic-like serine/threonine-protein kinase